LETKSKNDEMDRRGFFARVAMSTGLILSYGTGIVYGLQFLLPKRDRTKYRKLLVCSLEELPPDGSRVFKDLKGREIIIVNSKKGLKALSTECTHLGCKAYWEPENSRFFCPCHDGVFDTDGNVVSGPPPRPLDLYQVEVDGNDNVYVLVKEI